MSKAFSLDELLDAMPLRCIGPPRGGRVVAVAGDPVDAAVFYFGAVAGGVWKTDDAGTTWRNISDGYLGTASVGAIAVSESDPNVIYIGMGESTIRADVSHGDGVYRSTDGGCTWRSLGLTDTRHISEIRIHPRDPDRVYVAALGHAFGENAERGVFRSCDGGRRWERVLHVSTGAGAADLSLDPSNPDILYATIWEAHRSFWALSSGGPDSGLWRSRDGGDTWVDISRRPGLPVDTTLGKIGVSASPARPGRVYALVEANEGGGLYRSEDFGERWALVSDRIDLRYRPWYYMHVFADPQDADTVYVNNLGMWRSLDAGATFTAIPTPHGDNHDLWIDPRDNRRMVQGNDGGANVTFNSGDSWSTIYNQLTAQFYTVATDSREPFYHVYGTQQDNSSISVPSNSIDGAIVFGDCYAAGTGESGFIAVHPQDPDIVYVGAVGSSPGGGGALQRYDHRTGQIRLVSVWPEAHGGIGPGELRYRFPWTFPILFSPHDSGVLYTTGNVVFRSVDEGHSWTVISPDLTRNHDEKLGPSGGPITLDTSGAEHYCTLATLRESPHRPGELWAGSDDGLVHVSFDGGDNWHNVTPPALPEWSFVRNVEPSPHDAATTYLAATRYKSDDFRPYVYRTRDAGETWVSITGEGGAGIDPDDPVRVVRADPARAGVLYAGTERGLWVSIDDGASWCRWASNFPVVPVYDIAVRGTDLVVATHGRSFWVQDDLTPIHQYAARTQTAPAALYAPRQTWRILPNFLEAWISTDGKDYTTGLGKSATFIARKDEAGQLTREFLDCGSGGALGATVYYRLPEDLAEDAPRRLSFHTADGTEIRAFGARPAGYDRFDDEDKALDPGPWMPVASGVNRFVWDLRYPGAERLRGNKTGTEGDRGPLVLPGTYEVRLTVAEASYSVRFDLVNDPRSPVAPADLQAQQSLLLEIRDKLSELYRAVARLRAVRAQLESWRGRLREDPAASAVVASASAIEARLDEIEDTLIMPGKQIDLFGLNERDRLNAALATVVSVVESADAAPTEQARALAAEYIGRIDAQLAGLRETLAHDVGEFNRLVGESGLPAVSA